MEIFRTLIIGDVVGKPGRRALARLLPEIVQTHQIDLVIANGENAAGGLGITPITAKDLFSNGVDVITTGNHIFKHKEVLDYLDGDDPILRPANYPDTNPGRGILSITKKQTKITVINLQGRTFFDHKIANPFTTADSLLEDSAVQTELVFVDFHAEATSEKVAMGRYLDGRVTAVVGTHTHIQTADQCVLPKGTAYLTDIGMTGPIDSVIGVEIAGAVGRFVTEKKMRFSVAKGPARLDACIIESDINTKKAKAIQILSKKLG